MKKIYLFIIFLVLVSFVFHNGSFVANGQGTGGLPGANLTIQSIENIFNGLACWIVRIALILIVIYIIVVGIRYLIYSGQPQKIAEVNQSFKWVVMGSAVIMSVGIIVATIAWAIGSPLGINPLSC